MIELRPFEGGDVHYLINIDRKATDFPYDPEGWKIIIAADFPVLVATDRQTPVGFVTLFTGDDEGKVMWIGQLSVLPSYILVADLLLEAALEHARVEQCTRMKVTCCELDVEQCRWYVDKGFTIAGTVNDAYGLYGRTWEGYYFTKELHNEDAAQRMEGREHDSGEASNQDQ